MMIKKVFLILFCILMVSTVSACSDHGSSYQDMVFETAPLVIITQTGQRHDFIVEVAQTSEQKAYGLMFREELSDDQGMIFLFNDEAHRGFWMKNTLIFLDLLFIDGQGRIVKIHSMAQPHDTSIIRSDYPAKAVLEIRGGLASDLDINVGDIIEFKGF